MVDIGVILVLITENDTNLIQTLDVSVFKPFKTSLKMDMENLMIDKAVTSFSKKDTIEISLMAWNMGIMKTAATMFSDLDILVYGQYRYW